MRVLSNFKLFMINTMQGSGHSPFLTIYYMIYSSVSCFHTFGLFIYQGGWCNGCSGI